jgi:hypothetical protein
MSKPFKDKKPELNLDDLLAEISAIDTKKKTDKTMPHGREKSLPSQTEEMVRSKINIENPADPEEFNEAFDRDLDDNFISRDIEMAGKPNMPAPPEMPEIPYFPTMGDIENFLEQKVPKVPEHFTIEVPPEFEEIVPPEPLGAPPPPPVPPEGMR